VAGRKGCVGYLIEAVHDGHSSYGSI
jgi:hypothetical protein